MVGMAWRPPSCAGPPVAMERMGEFACIAVALAPSPVLDLGWVLNKMQHRKDAFETNTTRHIPRLLRRYSRDSWQCVLLWINQKQKQTR